ncbi:MAG: rhomboid family intramembrane serine protease [Acidobacteriota bacterium]
MIPLRHTSPRQTTPFANRGLVALNVAVFVVQYLLGNDAESLIRTFGFVPVRLLHPAGFGYAPWEVAITLFSSLFLHGGFVHLFGNMIYLWVFGDAVEDAFGHGRYLAFYLACGVVGSLTHTVFFPASTIPSVGASGSIAGVLGAFLVLRRRARIITLFPLVIYWAMAEVPAALFLPVWFAMQFFSGFLSLASARGTQEVSGVAWWAHVGGFVFGAAVAFFFKRAHRKRTMQPA